MACAGLWMAGMGACASSTAVNPGGENAAKSIAEVHVAKDGATTVITLLGLSEPVFTAFEQQNPDLVIVDLASVAADSLHEPVAVYDGLVQEVTMAPFSTGTGEPMTRVEISLTAPARYTVTPGEQGLVIRIDGNSDSAEALEPEAEEMGATPASDDPWAVAPMSEAGSTSEPIEIAEPTPAPAPAEPTGAPASKLLAVEVEKTAEGAMLHLRANGTLPSAETFALSGPSRLVIDLPGLQSAVAKNEIEVGSPLIAKVRVGRHDKMVRVVVDAGTTENAFEGRRVVPTANGLVVALGQGADLDQAVSAAAAASAPAMLAADAPSEPAPAAPAESAGEAIADGAADASGPVTIYGVEFDAQDERDRIVVLGERPIDYVIYEPDPETLVLSFEKASIDPEAAVRITPEAGGPVSLVTAFAQPDTKVSEVRVVVKRAAGLKPEITRRGALLVVDFPRSGAVAASPPILDHAAASAATEVGTLPPGSTTEAAAEAETLPHLPAPGAASGGGQAAPASLESPAAISVLQEGGLIDGKQYAGRRISLDFKDVDIADVLRLVAEVSDLNVIAGDEVKGKVTIRLIDVPWDQALDVILLTKGLGFMRVGNVLRIANADVLAKEEEARLQERRAKEKLEDLVVKLQPVNYAKVNDIQQMVQRLLTPRGTVNIDKRTNTLIIKDIASVIDEATALVKAIDTQTPQVMIESKIVEATLDFARDFGVTWGFGVNPLTTDQIGGDAFHLSPDANDLLGNNAQFTNPTAGLASVYNLGAFILDEKLNLNLRLQAAESAGDGKVISSPRLVTLDNSPAKIEQGVSIPFQTFENGDAQLEFVDAVLSLNVTPHITADRSIIMKVKVSRNAPDSSVVTLTGSPAIAKNQVDTETLVKDGQTLVIGGIYVVDTSQKQSRVPYLHTIPLLGALFRSDTVVDKRKELLIFVTPRIVVGPAIAG
ncbi:MAG: type IV pilus secretin PilQ [Candidatus Limnocylindria bacterium]